MLAWGGAVTHTSEVRCRDPEGGGECRVCICLRTLRLEATRTRRDGGRITSSTTERDRSGRRVQTRGLTFNTAPLPWAHRQSRAVFLKRRVSTVIKVYDLGLTLKSETSAHGVSYELRHQRNDTGRTCSF